MKISKLFHWLYATLMFLPLLVAPIFGIYSHRHTIDSYSVTTPHNQIVNFNQQVKNNNFVDSSYWYYDSFYGHVRFDNKLLIIDTPANTDYAIISQQIDLFAGHKYYISIGVTDYLSGSISYGLYQSNGWEEGFTQLINSNSITSFITPSVATEVSFGLLPNTLIVTSLTINYVNVVDLTFMFGSGNEPTLTQFEDWYLNEYYSYTLSRKELVQIGTTTYNDTDIGSQFLYTIYGTLDKYFNMSNLLPFNGLSDWIQLNFFNGNFTLGFYIFYNLFLYWFLISLLWLIFDVLMYVPNLAHRWLDRSSLQ